MLLLRVIWMLTNVMVLSCMDVFLYLMIINIIFINYKHVYN